jgi:hypothetical protein
LSRRLGIRDGVLPVNTSSSLLLGGNDPNPDSPSNRDLIRRVARHCTDKVSRKLVQESVIPTVFNVRRRI